MVKQKRGFFITLEGPDGSGKSTQFKQLAKRLRDAGFKVTETREPGGHPLAEKIRKLLLETSGVPPTPKAELMLFLAARAQHVSDVIAPALLNNRIVLCERFHDSTVAYQVGGRKLPAAFVEQANRFVTGGIQPDLTLLYDLPLEKGLKRAFQAKSGHDRMEAQPSAFLKAVRKGYRDIAKKHSNRVCLIQADQPLEKVIEQSWEKVMKKMKWIRKRCHAV
ncbi:dTMP kinase [bacterium]|nr:dTMP kinase [bacterium]